MIRKTLMIWSLEEQPQAEKGKQRKPRKGIKHLLHNSKEACGYIRNVSSKLPWAGEMAHRAKELAAKSDSLSLIPKSSMVEGEN